MWNKTTHAWEAFQPQEPWPAPIEREPIGGNKRYTLGDLSRGTNQVVVVREHFEVRKATAFNGKVLRFFTVRRWGQRLFANLKKSITNFTNLWWSPTRPSQEPANCKLLGTKACHSTLFWWRYHRCVVFFLCCHLHESIWKALALGMGWIFHSRECTFPTLWVWVTQELKPETLKE
jgi:hypothetical protein